MNYSELSDEELIELRDNTVRKISKYHNNQMARKIQINSLYGACGNQYFRYYKLDNAEAITISGQVSIQLIERKLNEYLNRILNTDNFDYVIAIDTDSIYLNMGPLVNKLFTSDADAQRITNFLDTICKEKLEPYIDQCYQEYADYVNAYEQRMKMKRENIADHGIWAAKKRYVLNVLDQEGVRYKEPKIKVLGLESVKSSTPEFIKPCLKTAYKIILKGTNSDLIDFIEDTKIKFREVNPSQIAFPRSLNNLDKYHCKINVCKSKTPIQVRGALRYNQMIRNLKLEYKYPYIQNGDKIRFIYLKVPNPSGDYVMSFSQDLPDEFNLKKYIDYEAQFEAAFIKPLTLILDTIDWKTKRVATLEDLFGD